MTDAQPRMCVAPLLACFALAMLQGCSAANGQDRQANPAPRSSPALCIAGERAIYTCRYGADTVSVCASATAVRYVYGRRGRPALTISSNGRDGRAFVGTIVGGGSGGQQHHIRFVNEGHDYIVYSARAGEYTDIAGAEWSGLVVRRGDTVLRESQCRQNRPAQRLDISGTTIELPEEDDPGALGWF